METLLQDIMESQNLSGALPPHLPAQESVLTVGRICGESDAKIDEITAVLESPAEQTKSR
jgi:hypothetical protein